MAKKMVKVMIDLEYSDGVDAESSSTSMVSEFVNIIEAGAAENSFDVTYIEAENLFEMAEQ